MNFERLNSVVMMNDEVQGALVQLRAFIANAGAKEGRQLPTERELVNDLGVTRNALRKALAHLEAEGLIWRHVGKGTFIGDRPAKVAPDMMAIAERSSPVEVMQARLLIEPMVAGQAALHATSTDLAALADIVALSRKAKSWREYESCDNALHHAIAAATHNNVLTSVFDTLKALKTSQ